MKIENKIRNTISLLINFFYPVKKITENSVFDDWQNNKIKKIIIIRQNQGLGDLLLFTPVIKAIKESKPDVIIDFFASSYNYHVIKTNKHIRKLYIWSKSDLINSIKLILQMRKENYDMALVVSSHTPSFTSFLYARLSKAKRIIGYDSFPFYNGALWSRCLSNLELPPPEKNISEIEKFARLVSPLKIKVGQETELFIAENILKNMREKYIALSKPVVGIFLGGNSKRTDRMWSVDNWAKVFAEFFNRGIYPIAIVPPNDLKAGGGNKEENLYNVVCKLLNKKIPYFSDYDIINIAGFIKNLKLLISPDGGIFHISVAVKTNTIGLFIKTDSKRWSPKVSCAVAVQSTDGTCDGIKVEDVVEKAIYLINKQ